MTEGRVALNGSGPQTIYINTYRVSQNTAGNYSTYRSVGVYEGQGYGSWTDYTQYWSANLGGYQISGTFTIPYNNRFGNITLYDVTWNRGHDGNGNGSAFNSTFCVDTNHSRIGDGCVTVPEGTPPRIARIPSTPGTPVLSSVTPTSMKVSWTLPADNGGAGLDQILVRYNTNPNPDAAGQQNIVLGGGVTSTTMTNLTPGVMYYVKVYAHNAVGYSPGSGVTSQRTLVSDPPSMVITATPAGTAVSVALGPPGGISGVTKYTVEYRLVGGTSKSVDVVTPPLVIEGLTPGAEYEYRSSAWFGTYQTPWTGWTRLTQPQPNTFPGDFFDGSTTDKPDLDYQWTGTAHASTSIAVGRGVDGWTGSTDGSRPFIIQQVTGGAVSAYSARMTFQADLTAVGGWLGQGSFTDATKNAVVVGGAVYVASVSVMPSRAQALNAGIVWLTEALAVISTSNAVGVLCLPGEYTRLAVTGLAPATAKYAIIVVDDYSPHANWVIWKSGEWVQADAVMLTLSEAFEYFDGDTVDTTQYQYSWQGAPHASASVRDLQTTATATESPIFVGGYALVDPDCPAVPAPPRPPIVPSNCITDTGQWRRYWSYIPASAVEDWLTTIPTLELVTGAAAERQVRIRYYADPFNRPSAAVKTDDYCSEQILSYIPASTRMTLDGVSERVFAEIKGGAPVSADHLLYGSKGQPADWPHLSCGIGYWVSLDVPSSSTEGNLDVTPYLTTRV